MISVIQRALGKHFVYGKPYAEGFKKYAFCGQSGTARDFIMYQGRETGIVADYKRFWWINNDDFIGKCRKKCKPYSMLHYIF